MTNEEMSGQVKQWLGLQDIEDYDETALIPQLLHQGAIDLLSRTRCTVRCIDLQVQANVQEYMLDHGVLALVDVEDGRQRARRDETAGPSFALIRSDLLRLNPAPSSAGELQIWAVKRPGRMNLPTDTPAMELYGAIPDEYHDAIVTWALWHGADYTDDAGSQQGDRYRVIYEGQDGRGGRIQEIKKLVNKRGTARAPKRRVRLRPVASSGTWTG